MSDAPRRMDDLPEDWEQQDAIGSYYVAVAAIGERVKAGEPVPWFFRSSRVSAVEDAQ